VEKIASELVKEVAKRPTTSLVMATTDGDRVAGPGAGSVRECAAT